MSFKAILRDDAKKTFLNLEEFTDEHEINGRMMPALIDSNELESREKLWRTSEYQDGVYTKMILVYVLASNYGRMPAVGSRVTVDGKPYACTNAINEDGIYSLELEATRS